MTATPQDPISIYGAGTYRAIANYVNPTPTSFDVMQDMTLTYKRGVESLWGRKQLPAAIRGGQVSLTGKVTTGSDSGRRWGDLLIGAGFQNQMDHWAEDEPRRVGTAGRIVPVNVAATNPKATFLRDGGLRDPATGLPLVNVASVTKRGQYSVDADGTYHVDTSYAGSVLWVSYEWQEQGPQYGTKIVMVNQDQGTVGSYASIMAYESGDAGGDQNVFTLNRCITTDAEIGSKNGKFANPTHSFTCSADSFGIVGTLSFAQKR